MKNAKKILIMVLCAVLLVGATIAGTVAYLTDTDNVVTNTMTVGKVEIKLDEAKVNEYGVADTAADRVTTNKYKLVPGESYTKDPTVHVKNDSEPSYIFVKIVNGLADIEDTTTIHNQILGKGWKELSGVSGVYYKEWTKDASETDDYTDLVVFENFKIKSSVTAVDLNNYTGKTITVNAYAIQKAGFEGKPADAWKAVNPNP